MLQVLLKGIGLGLILALSVGPVIFTVIKQSINHGRRGGFAFISGVWVSDFIWMLLSTFFSTLVAQLLSYKNYIALGGSFFLISMGIYFLFFKVHIPRESKEIVINDEEVVGGERKVKYFSIFSAGFIINTLNPSVIAFWMAIAGGLASEYDFWERVTIFSACLVTNILFDCLKVFGAGRLGKTLSDKNIVRINKVSGLLYLIFALAVIIGIIFTNKPA